MFTSNRTLKTLAALGVRHRAKTVYVDDWDVPVTAGDFDPAYPQSNLKPEQRIRIFQ